MKFWQKLLTGLFGSNIKDIAKEALKGDVEELKSDIRDLHIRANKIEDNYVTCKFCNTQHDTLTKTLSSMDGKLDILIAKI